MLRRLIEAISPSAKDFVVEIGPGEGSLTRLLLETPAHVEAIELDRDLAAGLKQEFPGLTLHVGDALDFDFAVFPEGFRVVGNLPYNISTPLLFHLASHASRVRDMHFMLQFEVVERMVAAPATPEARAVMLTPMMPQSVPFKAAINQPANPDSYRLKQGINRARGQVRDKNGIF